MVSFDRSRQQEAIVFHKHDSGEAVIVQDWATFILGYSSRDMKAGERIPMRYSEVELLIEKLAPEFGYVKSEEKKKWYKRN